jgi:apurinic endonuclease APN1
MYRFSQIHTMASTTGGGYTMVFHDPTIRMGYHITKQKTLEDTFTRMLPTPLRSYQVYLANARSWAPPVVDVDDIMRARDVIKKNGKYMCVHASLLYNIAGATKGTTDPKYYTSLANTRRNLMIELDIAAGMGSGAVVHTGSRKDKDAGLIDTTETITHVLSKDAANSASLAKASEMSLYEFKKTRKVILENSAGEGNKLGSSLQSISDIIETIDEDYRDQVKVCIDTAHAAGSGEYDFGIPDEVVRFYNEFDDLIGLDRLEVFHLNDSRVPVGSKRDLHENLSLGHLFSSNRDDGLDGLEGLKTFLEYAQHHEIPFIGEPPAKTKDGEIGPGGVWDYNVLRKIYKNLRFSL